MNALTCEEVFRRLDDFMDRELRPDEILQVEKHLDTCGECAAEYRFEASVLGLLREKLQHIAVPPDLLEKVRRRLQSNS